jgi:hypothetical protein
MSEQGSRSRRPRGHARQADRYAGDGEGDEGNSRLEGPTGIRRRVLRGITSDSPERRANGNPSARADEIETGCVCGKRKRSEAGF